MSQSEFPAISSYLLKAQEKSRLQAAIVFGFGFGFAFHWLKNWREKFQALNVAIAIALFLSILSLNTSLVNELSIVI